MKTDDKKKVIESTCIEINAQGKRIVLDFGLPLDAPDLESHEDLLLQVPDERDVAGRRE